MPFGNRFWASNWPTGRTPLPGLSIHMILSVRDTLSGWPLPNKHVLKIIVILAPPPNVAYPFILDVEVYPGQIINLFIVIVRRPIYILCASKVETIFILGSVLVAMAETRHPAAVQRCGSFVIPRNIVGLISNQCGGHSQCSSSPLQYSVSLLR